MAKGHQDEIKELAKLIGTDLVNSLQQAHAYAATLGGDLTVIGSAAPGLEVPDRVKGMIWAATHPVASIVQPWADLWDMLDPLAPPGSPAPAAGLTEEQKRALRTEAARKRDLEHGSIFGGAPPVPLNPFQQRLADQDRQRELAQQGLRNLGLGVGLAAGTQADRLAGYVANRWLGNVFGGGGGQPAREPFQSQRMDAADLVSQVTQAALSKPDPVRKAAEDTAKAAKGTEENTKRLVGLLERGIPAVFK